MNKHLGDTPEPRAANLKLIKTWVGKGGWNLNRRQKRDDVPALSKARLDKLQLKY